MGGLTLLSEAREAGLTVTAQGDRLIVRGPRRAEAVARRLLAHKAELIAGLSAGGAAPVPEQFEGSDMQIGHQRPALSVLERDEHVVTQRHHEPGVADVVVRPTGEDHTEGLEGFTLEPVADVVGVHTTSIPRAVARMETPADEPGGQAEHRGQPQPEPHADREVARFLAVCRPWPDGQGWHDPALLRDAAGRGYMRWVAAGRPGQAGGRRQVRKSDSAI